MKSLVFWAALGLVATVSASWMDRDVVDPMGGVQVVAQQQVIEPHFPAQALGGGPAVNSPPQFSPVTPPVVTAPVNPPPPVVMPRPVPGVPGPPPQAPGIAVAQPLPGNPLQRARTPRTFPALSPAPAQAAIPH